MKICFPIRDLDGKEFTSVEEVMGLINSEPHGGWLLGANGLWHGGIHISDITQPHAALNNGAQDYGEPMPLQFMADGTIVAYRVNDVYQSAPWCNKPLRYSSTFALVKSLCQPDPKKETSWLEFYTLYMHLAAVEDYATSPCFRVSKGHNGISLRKYSKGQHGLAEDDSHPTYSAALNAPATVRGKVVNEGDRFVVSRTGRFYVTRNNKTTLLPLGLSRVLKEGKPSGEQYWITLDPELVVRDGEMHNLMPEWMNQAKAKGTFNSVVNTDGSAAWQVKAGMPVGFMGLNEIPGTGSARVEQERYVHLEVLSTDSRMPGFLSNPGEVKKAGKLVRTLSGRKIWLRSAAMPPLFTVTDATLSSGSLVSRERTTPFKDASDKWWFKVSDHGWMPQEDVEEIEQYDLLKQGFYPLAEESDGDMLHGFMEGWVPELFGRIAELTEGNNSSTLAGRVPEYYRTLIARLDENGDGEISADEIRRGLGRRDPAVRDIVDRLIVKHHSEWIGGPSEARWKGFYKILDRLSIPYCTQWQSGQEWMSQVEVFKGGKPVWHMHPVKFLDAITDNENDMDVRWLTVPRGQLTFDAEGNDIDSSPWFSRKAHWPGGVSGITIGRGYDLGHQSSAESDLLSLAINQPLRSWLVGSSGMSSTVASSRLQAASIEIRASTISRKQQHELFILAYQRLEDDVKRISQKPATIRAYHPNPNTSAEQAWADIPDKIKEILADLRYRGDYTPEIRAHIQKPAYSGDVLGFGAILSNREYWSNVPQDRFDRRRQYYES